MLTLEEGSDNPHMLRALQSRLLQFTLEHFTKLQLPTNWYGYLLWSQTSFFDTVDSLFSGGDASSWTGLSRLIHFFLRTCNTGGGSWTTRLRCTRSWWCRKWCRNCLDLRFLYLLFKSCTLPLVFPFQCCHPFQWFIFLGDQPVQAWDSLGLSSFLGQLTWLLWGWTPLHFQLCKIKKKVSAFALKVFHLNSTGQSK